MRLITPHLLCTLILYAINFVLSIQKLLLGVRNYDREHFHIKISRYTYLTQSRVLYLSIKNRLYLHPHMWGTPLRAPNACTLLRFTQIVVEVSSVRSLPADCPIYKLFKPYPFRLISSFCFGIIALRVFQQFNVLFNIQITLYGNYS